MKPLCLLSFALMFTGAVEAAVPDPVHLDSGSISGIPANDQGVRVFKGIPYAAPPLGDLRWRAPQPAAHWDGVRKAEQFGPSCTAGGGAGRGGKGKGPGGAPLPTPIPAASEDCLYVNVWTPAKAATDRLPVMVWTYGGAFTSGSGSVPGYDGTALAEKGIVVVTYNYRLGVFGFLAHPELTKESGHNASGNYGLMDLAAVLRGGSRRMSRHSEAILARSRLPANRRARFWCRPWSARRKAKVCSNGQSRKAEPGWV